MLINDRMREWATAAGATFDLAAETEQFLDHHRGKGTLAKDWDASWRTWIRNAVKFQQQRGQQQRKASGFDEQGRYIGWDV